MTPDKCCHLLVFYKFNIHVTGVAEDHYKHIKRFAIIALEVPGYSAEVYPSHLSR